MFKSVNYETYVMLQVWMRCIIMMRRVITCDYRSCVNCGDNVKLCDCSKLHKEAYVDYIVI